MRRKIILHGPSSLTVSLPSQWVKKNHLKKGDEIDILEEKDGLLIKPIGQFLETKKINVSFKNLNEKTWKDLLLIFHNKGYDEIDILMNSENEVNEIYSYLNEMQLGFEIIKQDANEITIRNISNPEFKQFNNLFRRIFRILIEYAKKIGIIMKEKNNFTESCLLHEKSIKRISNYCKRILMIEDKTENLYSLYLVTRFETIAYNLSNLLDYVKYLEDNIPLEISDLYDEIINLLIEVYHLHYNFTIEEYDKIKSKLIEFKAKMDFNKNKYEPILCLTNIELVYENIFSTLKPILSINL